MGFRDKNEKSEIYSERIKAGRRTYFLDIKPTNANDFYLSITESRRLNNDDGSFSYQKTKIHVYKEDIYKLTTALQSALDYMRELLPDHDFELDRNAQNLDDEDGGYHN